MVAESCTLSTVGRHVSIYLDEFNYKRAKFKDLAASSATCLCDGAYSCVSNRLESRGHALWSNEEEVPRVQCDTSTCQPPDVSVRTRPLVQRRVAAKASSDAFDKSTQ